MSDARWIEIEGDFQAACIHFARAAELYDAGGFDEAGLGGYRTSMAFLHAMQSGHTSLEAGLVRILNLLGEERPQGEYWHRDLLTRVCQPVEGRDAILPPDLCDHADETRRFRNVATRNYDNFQISRADPAVDAARFIAARLPDCLSEFKARIHSSDNADIHDGSGGATSGGSS